MKYDDIINFDYQGPYNHKKMTRLNRAAQFAPFAALEGYEDSIEEAGKIYETRIELSEDEKSELNGILKNCEGKTAEVTYFSEINIREGRYLKKEGRIKKTDVYEQCLIFTDKEKINFDDIYQVKMLE